MDIDKVEAEIIVAALQLSIEKVWKGSVGTFDERYESTKRLVDIAKKFEEVK